MQTVWAICAWTGFVWWCMTFFVLAVAGAHALWVVYALDSEGEPYRWDE